MDSRSAANLEKAQIAKKRGSNRTEADEVRLRELEWSHLAYLDEGETPTLPAAAFRSNMEAAARKLKQGPQVREGRDGRDRVSRRPPTRTRSPLLILAPLSGLAPICTRGYDLGIGDVNRRTVGRDELPT